MCEGATGQLPSLLGRELSARYLKVDVFLGECYLVQEEKLDSCRSHVMKWMGFLCLLRLH